jgi:DNA modification methylase
MFPGEQFYRSFQKPLSLMSFLVKMHSEPGDTVSDFFCGTGTTAVAAAMAGRYYVVCDYDPNAISITQNRLEKLCNEKFS